MLIPTDSARTPKEITVVPGLKLKAAGQALDDVGAFLAGRMRT
jgi:hypothetical protein